MKKKEERKYSIDVRECYNDFEDHYDTARRFGYFSEDGNTYTVTDPDTPRQWLNMLYNDKFASVISNRGEGYTIFGGFYNRVTRYYNTELYLVRDLDGKRVLEVLDLDSGETVNLFDSRHVTCKVTPGCSEFFGEEAGIAYRVRVFVPTDAYCECWLIELRNTDSKTRRLRIHAQQTWTFHNHIMKYGNKRPCEKLSVTSVASGYMATAPEIGKPFDTLYGTFTAEGYTSGMVEKKVEKKLCTHKKDPAVYKDFPYTYVNLYADVKLDEGESAKRTVVSAASEQAEVTLATAQKYIDSKVAETAWENTLAHWKDEFSHNTCILPDKNLERFLNTWLKYQLGLTYVYNRNSQNGGFRDVLQDCWGTMLIRPDYSKARMVEALSHVYSDGHSMRGYDSYAGLTDKDDFVDCPLWAPCTVLQYLKETGDFGFLQENLPYFDSDVCETVEEHLWKMVNYPYVNRGANGLVLMRDGDWLDGLSGVNQNGTATSAWATMQAYWAQDCMAQIYDAVGDQTKADLMRARNAEYKKVVRDVSWDGKWYVYGFKSDGLPIGSSRCKEGKIYLNPQVWAIFTGIEDDPKRIKQIRQSVNVYLTTVFGPLLLYPPYVNDKTCGRISGQLPGTFANAAVYLHGGTFKVYADVAAGEYDDAYDTFMRLLPNHPDNSDSRRTSEPYCTGNVHFGPDSPCFGMNLFSWFTATPAWLIHAGFDRLLGVETDFDGLHITPRVPSDWDSYAVKRSYRGLEYRLQFRRAVQGEEVGIYRDGTFVAKNCLPLGSKEGEYSVLY